MYKSSKTTFFYKYIFTPLICVGTIIGALLSWSHIDKLYNLFWMNTLIGGYCCLWLVIMSIKLKSVVADSNNFIIKKIGKNKIVDYKDIEWVYQIELGSPTLISVKYFDNISNKYKKILIIPSLFFQMHGNSIKGSEFVKYIKERQIESRPDSLKIKHPSKWLPLLLINIPVIIIIMILNILF